MNSQALETTMREKISFVVLIEVDDAYGLIEWKMNMEPGRSNSIAFTSPDFVQYVKSFGAKGTPFSQLMNAYQH